MVTEKDPGKQGIVLCCPFTWDSSVNCRVRWGLVTLPLWSSPILLGLAPVPLGEPSLLEAVVRVIDFYFFVVDNAVRPRSPSGSGVMERPVMRVSAGPCRLQACPLCFGRCLWSIGAASPSFFGLRGGGWERERIRDLV